MKNLIIMLLLSLFVVTSASSMSQTGGEKEHAVLITDVTCEGYAVYAEPPTNNRARRTSPYYTQLHITIQDNADVAFYEGDYMQDGKLLDDIPEKNILYVTSYNGNNSKSYTYKTFLYGNETWTVHTGFDQVYTLNFKPLQHRNGICYLTLIVEEGNIRWEFGDVYAIQEPGYGASLYIQ